MWADEEFCSSASFAPENSTSTSPSKCECTPAVAEIQYADTPDRFVDNEQWRSGFNGGVDNLVRTFDYKERPQVFKYYPQYYHKTDKVGADPMRRESPVH